MLELCTSVDEKKQEGLAMESNTQSPPVGIMWCSGVQMLIGVQWKSGKFLLIALTSAKPSAKRENGKAVG